MRGLPSLGPRGEGWLLAQIALAVVLANAARRGPAWRGPARVATAAIGLSVIGGGALLGLRGARDLGRSLSPFPKPRCEAQLVDTGIYADVRHPIYGGQLLMSIGWALAAASPAALAILPLAATFLYLKSRREEALLEWRFPGYGEYRARTHRMIPGVW